MKLKIMSKKIILLLFILFSMGILVYSQHTDKYAPQGFGQSEEWGN
jgi:hypothetical protein